LIGWTAASFGMNPEEKKFRSIGTKMRGMVRFSSFRSSQLRF